MLGSSSPRELEQLELERVNGVRALIGLTPLPPPPSFGGSVRHSRPGTPLYTGSSPSTMPSPAPYPPPSHRPHAGSYRQSASSGGQSGAAGYGRHRQQDHRHARDERGWRPADARSRAQHAQSPDIEEAEGSEEGELLE
ncbi:hypothetical protein IWQ56_004527 [Coemansia nantahalensis]|nr:hypothetical protein IWQ56_004527 [Coemansia nantahalensis]